MSGLLLRLIIFAFLCLYIFFRRESSRKLKQHLSETDLKATEKQRRSIFFLSVLTILGSLMAAWFPSLANLGLSPENYQNGLVESLGKLLVKLSFVWLVVCGLQVSANFDALFSPMNTREIVKNELATLVGVTILSIGILLVFPGIPTFLFTSISIGTFLIASKKLKISRLQKDEA